jgi:hypothetical protein
MSRDLDSAMSDPHVAGRAARLLVDMAKELRALERRPGPYAPPVVGAATCDPNDKQDFPLVYDRWGAAPRPAVSAVGYAQRRLNRFLRGIAAELSATKSQSARSFMSAQFAALKSNPPKSPERTGDLLDVDCKFGPATTTATKIFQAARFSFTPGAWDGKIGLRTWFALEMAPTILEGPLPAPSVVGFDPSPRGALTTIGLDPCTDRCWSLFDACRRRAISGTQCLAQLEFCKHECQRQNDPELQPRVYFVAFRNTGTGRCINTPLGVLVGFGMTTAAEVHYHVAEALRGFADSFVIRRRVHAQLWQRVGTAFELVGEDPAGTVDDPDLPPECFRIPEIFSLDTPGPPVARNADRFSFGSNRRTSPDAREFRFQMNAREWVEAIRGPRSVRVSDDVLWHSILHMRRDIAAVRRAKSAGTALPDWQNTGASRIRLGHISMGRPP